MKQRILQRNIFPTAKHLSVSIVQFYSVEIIQLWNALYGEILWQGRLLVFVYTLNLSDPLPLFKSTTNTELQSFYDRFYKYMYWFCNVTSYNLIFLSVLSYVLPTNIFSHSSFPLPYPSPPPLFDCYLPVLESFFSSKFLLVHGGDEPLTYE